MIKRICCFVTAICCTLIILADARYPLQKQIIQLSCIDYNVNRLIFPGDSSKFKLLYEKLDSLMLFGTKKINIINIGGSHIQAGAFPNRLRMNFANYISGKKGESGVIFPFKVAKTNNPKNFTITYTGKWAKSQNSKSPINESLGITGYAISTNSKDASIYFNLNPDKSNSQWNYNRLRLLAEISNKDFIPLLIIDGDTIIAKEETSSYVFYLKKTAEDGKIILGKIKDYNRLANKYNSTLFSEESTSVELASSTYNENETYTLEIGHESDNGLEIIKENKNNYKYDFTITGIIPENDFSGITYHSLGVNGASLKSWLRCDKFVEQMKLLNPDLAILSVGINDANVPQNRFNKEIYKERYNKLINEIYLINPNCAIIFITNNDCILRSGKYSNGINKNSIIIQEAIYELAEEHGAAVWDLFKIMGGLGSISVWKEQGLANNDRVHFLVPGYYILGDMMYNAIIYDWLYKTDRK